MDLEKTPKGAVGYPKLAFYLISQEPFEPL